MLDMDEEPNSRHRLAYKGAEELSCPAKVYKENKHNSGFQIIPNSASIKAPSQQSNRGLVI